MKALFKSLAKQFKPLAKSQAKPQAKPEKKDESTSRRNLQTRKDNDLPQSTAIRAKFLRGREWQHK